MLLWSDWFPWFVRSDEHLPTSVREVRWATFMDRLSYMDEDNVREVLGRLKRFSLEKQLPLAVMGIGSVLSKPPDKYRDIDILVLPVEECDVRRSEKLLARFIESQPEIYLYPNTKRVFEGQWEDVHGYNQNRYWNLAFPQGKDVQLFINSGRLARTLRSQVKMELDAYGDYGKSYAILELDQ